MTGEAAARRTAYITAAQSHFLNPRRLSPRRRRFRDPQLAFPVRQSAGSVCSRPAQGVDVEVTDMSVEGAAREL